MPPDVQSADGSDAPPTVAPSGVPSAPPAYRNGKGVGENWQQVAAALPSLYPNRPNTQRALAEIFAAEGGMKTDARSRTPRVGGIQQGGGDDLSSPGGVLAAQGRHLDRSLRTIGGTSSLDQFNDPESAAAFGDTVFRNGPLSGTRYIQQATNDVIDSLSPAERDRLGISKITIDGKMGPQTFGAFRTVANDPAYAAQLRGALGDRRAAFRDPVSNQLEGGDRARFEHFRFAGE